MKLKFDGFIFLKEGDRFWGHYRVFHDGIFFHSWGICYFAVGWHRGR
jgi:hypothetical protein